MGKWETARRNKASSHRAARGTGIKATAQADKEQAWPFGVPWSRHGPTKGLAEVSSKNKMVLSVLMELLCGGAAV